MSGRLWFAARQRFPCFLRGCWRRFVFWDEACYFRFRRVRIVERSRVFDWLRDSVRGFLYGYDRR